MERPQDSSAINRASGPTAVPMGAESRERNQPPKDNKERIAAPYLVAPARRRLARTVSHPPDSHHPGASWPADLVSPPAADPDDPEQRRLQIAPHVDRGPERVTRSLLLDGKRRSPRVRFERTGSGFDVLLLIVPAHPATAPAISPLIATGLDYSALKLKPFCCAGKRSALWRPTTQPSYH